jgi:hypothetical protein
MKAAFLMVLLVVAAYPSSAWAYLDPGAGTAILQGILATVVSVGVVLKMYWHQFLAFVRKLSKRTDDHH